MALIAPNLSGSKASLLSAHLSTFRYFKSHIVGGSTLSTFLSNTNSRKLKEDPPKMKVPKQAQPRNTADAHAERDKDANADHYSSTDVDNSSRDLTIIK